MSKKRVLVWLAATSAVCVGCSREELIPEPAVLDGVYPIELFNEVHQQAKTRVNDEGFCDGDAVGIYVVNYVDGNPGTMALQGNQANNVKYTLDESSNSWVPESPVYYYDKVTHVDIYGYYPYGSPSSVTEYTFEVERDQSKDAANGNMSTYEASDFLWAKASDITPVASRVPLLFEHKMAGVQVTIVEGTGFEDGEFSVLSKSVLITNTIRKAKIDLTTGFVTADGAAPETGIVPMGFRGDWRAIVVPQTITAQTQLFALTVDGLPYSYRKADAFTYEAGKLHSFTISVNKKADTGLEFKVIGESITAWEADPISHDGTAREYVIVNCPEGGKLKETMAAAGMDYTKIKNLKVTGVINESDYYFMRDEMTVLQGVNLKDVISDYTLYYTDADGVNVMLEYGIPYSAFLRKSSLVRIVFPDNIRFIADNAFDGTNLVGSLVIPDGVSYIGGCAFGENNMGLPLSGTLKLPKALKYIGPFAFGYGKYIGELELPALVETIGEGAFVNCTGFSGKLILPQSLKQISGAAFANCTGFTGSLEIPSGIEFLPAGSWVGTGVFQGCSGLDGELKLPDDMVTVPRNTFNGCGFRYPINFPNSLIVIEDRAFASCQFTGELVLPPNLEHIGEGAFCYNYRMSGNLVLPESISHVSNYAFSGCSQLSGIEIPSRVESIGDCAFAYCYQITSIIVKAEEPPILGGSVFDGVGKDNMTVEVPELSVNDYSTALGWNEFKRFSAHREFSVSRNLFRTLNAEYTKGFLIRAESGASWSVESKPDWVTISPDHGVGKMEVEITAQALAHGVGNREGEVVFLLDGKDYRVRTTIQQYDYMYGDGDIITIQTHTVGNGVNLVFMGDCFDAKDISEGIYVDALNEAIGYFFDIEPYKTYQDYFDVYVVVGLSPDSGVGTVNTIREARFGTQYTLNSGLEPDVPTCFEAACLAPIDGDVAHSLVIMIENSELYGGVTYMYGDGSAIAICPMSRDLYPYDFRGLVQHEAGGHGFGKLADEYIYHNAFVTACPFCLDYLVSTDYYQKKARGWYENIHHVGNLHSVPWYHLMMDPEYSDIVDIYEGGYLHTRGVFRSEPTSCMNNNIPYYSTISRESIVKRIMEYSGEEFTYENFKANDVKTASVAGTRSGKPWDVWSDRFEPGHQHEPKYMGDKPVFNRKTK